MKPTWSRLALCLSSIACAGVPRPASEATAELRVLVYNIHAGKDAHRVDSIPAIAALVLASSADIVLLQEVDRNTVRSGHVDQIAELARRTGYHSAFGKMIDYNGGEYGIAMLSRWPLMRDTVIHYAVQPSNATYEQRGALRARIATPIGTLTIMNTHFDASGSEAYRSQEARALRGLVTAALDAGETVLVGGDFNSVPESATQDSLRHTMRDAWSECGKGPGLSFPADTPVKRIDYLFLTGTLRCSSADVLANQASDHRPVLVHVVR